MARGNSANEEGPGFEGTIDVEPGDRIPLTPASPRQGMLDWQISSMFSVNADAMYVGGSYARGNENNEHEPDGVYYIGRGAHRWLYRGEPGVPSCDRCRP